MPDIAPDPKRIIKDDQGRLRYMPTPIPPADPTRLLSADEIDAARQHFRSYVSGHGEVAYEALTQLATTKAAYVEMWNRVSRLESERAGVLAERDRLAAELADRQAEVRTMHAQFAKVEADAQALREQVAALTADRDEAVRLKNQSTADFYVSWNELIAHGDDLRAQLTAREAEVAALREILVVEIIPFLKAQRDARGGRLEQAVANTAAAATAHDEAVRAEERARVIEECATTVLEQRCERGTPWDRACLAIAAAIRALAGEPT